MQKLTSTLLNLEKKKYKLASEFSFDYLWEK